MLEKYLIKRAGPDAERFEYGSGGLFVLVDCHLIADKELLSALPG